MYNIFLCSCFSQVLIDITENPFSPNGPRPSQTLKKLQCSTIEIIDLNNLSESRVSFPSKSHGKRHQAEYTVDLEKDVICLSSGDGNDGQSPVPVSHDQQNSYTKQYNSVRSCLQGSNTQRSVNVSPSSSLKDISLRFEASNGFLEFFKVQDTNCTQQTSASPLAENNLDHDASFDSSHSWLNKTLSPFSLDSAYYCPSEIDAAVFSDESLILIDNDQDQDQNYTSCSLDKTELPFEVGKSMAPQEKKTTQTSSPHPQTQMNSHLDAQTLPTPDRASLPTSPTSTELLAGDSPETGSDLDMESPAVSPVNSPYTLSPPSHAVLGIEDSASVLEESGGDDDADTEDLSEHRTDDGQQISLVQFRKLKYLLGARDQDTVNICFDYFFTKRSYSNYLATQAVDSLPCSVANLEVALCLIWLLLHRQTFRGWRQLTVLWVRLSLKLDFGRLRYLQ